MKETLLQLSKYNIWANKKMIDVLLQLDEETLDREIISSFNSLRTTVYHTWGAEHIWLQRFQLAEHPVWMPAVFTGTFSEACALWEEQSKGLQAFVEKQFSDEALQHVFEYLNLQRIPQKAKVSDVLLHVFNHSTYHRGQLVTMLRQAGVRKIPSTDIVQFVKK
jgi:uncharacterized damage-inducible protein DinB